MSHQFAQLVIIHYKPVLRQRILPKFAGVVEKNSRDQEIKIQLGVKGRDLLRHPHHLCCVFDQSAAPGVVIITRSGGPPEPVAPFFQEHFTDDAKPGVTNRLHS